MGCPLSKKFASLCHPFVVSTYLKCVYLVGVSVENSASKNSGRYLHQIWD